MKTLTRVLTIVCIIMSFATFVSIIGWNAEFHSNPVLQIGAIANAFIGVGALGAWLANDC